MTPRERRAGVAMWPPPKGMKLHMPSFMPHLFCQVMGCITPVRSSNICDLIFGMKDASDEIKADIQKLEWLLIAGEGLMMERLLRVQTSEERNETNKSE